MTLAEIIRRVKAAVSSRRVKAAVSSEVDYVVYEGAILPPPKLRKGPPQQRNDEVFLQSARREARRLADHFHLGKHSSILDIGCGPGRLPIGILSVIGPVDYTGIDVQAVSIHWCKQYIQRTHPSFQFHHINAANQRYNKNGVEIAGDFEFDFPDKRFDIIVLLSVFSHMLERDVRIYLQECKRLLKGHGRIYLTAFVEEGVPNISVNPAGYFPRFSGPLHVVRYEKDYIFTILRDSGFSVDEFSHHGNGLLSTVYLSQSH
jgi:SAM-dependent methyltransferase